MLDPNLERISKIATGARFCYRPDEVWEGNFRLQIALRTPNAAIASRVTGLRGRHLRCFLNAPVLLRAAAFRRFV